MPARADSWDWVSFLDLREVVTVWDNRGRESFFMLESPCCQEQQIYIYATRNSTSLTINCQRR